MHKVLFEVGGAVGIPPIAPACVVNTNQKNEKQIAQLQNKTLCKYEL